jgi:hypothetical protein
MFTYYSVLRVFAGSKHYRMKPGIFEEDEVKSVYEKEIKTPP